jgi:hypothetical protein
MSLFVLVIEGGTLGTGVKVKVNLKGIERKVTPMGLARVKGAVASQMVMDMNRFIPKQSGELRANLTKANGEIVYNAPYARIQFYGKKRKGFFSKNKGSFSLQIKKNYLNIKKPGTGPRWDKKASALYYKNWEQVAKKALELK